MTAPIDLKPMGIDAAAVKVSDEIERLLSAFQQCPKGPLAHGPKGTPSPRSQRDPYCGPKGTPSPHFTRVPKGPYLLEKFYAGGQ
jgi:hypothetical protein